MKKYIAYVLLIIATAGSSCKKSFLDQTDNPNAPTSANSALVLTGALNTSARLINTGFTLEGYYMGYWSPGAGYAPNASLLTYNLTTADGQVWNAYYLNLANYDYIIKQAGTNPSQTFFVAISQIMEAYNFQVLVDNYNNVPYTQAFQGAGNLTPAYDTGASIYAALVTKLDAAMASINSANTGIAVNPKSSDIMFGGNMTLWKQLANTIKLRLLIRESTKVITNPATITAALANHLTEGFLTTDATVNPGYTNTDGKQSPFWATYGFSQSGANNAPSITANAFAVNFLNVNHDTRASLFYTPVSGAIVGNNFGTPNPITASNIGRGDLGQSNPSNTLGLLKNPSMNAMVFSAAESYFLQSEAALKGIIAGNAQTFYESGITASYITAGATAAQAVTYYTQPLVNVNWATSTDKLQAIITQKWVALNGYNNLEAYNEYRRTGYPKVPISIYTGVTATAIPSRILYPNTEYNANADNVGAQGAINQFTSKIFWATY